MSWKRRLLVWLSGGAVRTRYPGADQALYLTFDDGPDPQHTPAVLELLRRHDAKAVFFLIGSNAERHPELARSIVEAGHHVGNHSMNHPWFNRIAAAAQRLEISAADRVLERFDGRALHPFRPPHGRATLGSVLEMRRRGQTMLLWSYDSLDYTLGSTELTERLRNAPLSGGDVLLFHDDGAAAVHALETMLPIWKRAGFHFPLPA